MAHLRSLPCVGLVLCAVALTGMLACAQAAGPLDSVGTVTVQGRAMPYLIRHLPMNSFPDLPGPVAAALTARGCTIPQTYEAHRPENVIHASLEKTGSSDWAVLCSAQGRVDLLVFWGSNLTAEPVTLATATELERLQPNDSNGHLGFDWGIDAASPKRVHDAQASMAHRPPAPDHDCVAETILDRRTVFHLYRDGAWVTMPGESY